MTELSRILARMLALDVEQYPKGPPAEVSDISRTGSSRRRPERIITGRLQDDTCSPWLRVVGGAA